MDVLKGLQCVVCYSSSGEGKLRKSGFKCLKCIGTSHKRRQESTAHAVHVDVERINVGCKSRPLWIGSTKQQFSTKLVKATVSEYGDPLDKLSNFQNNFLLYKPKVSNPHKPVVVVVVCSCLLNLENYEALRVLKWANMIDQVKCVVLATTSAARYPADVFVQNEQKLNTLQKISEEYKYSRLFFFGEEPAHQMSTFMRVVPKCAACADNFDHTTVKGLILSELYLQECNPLELPCFRNHVPMPRFCPENFVNNTKSPEVRDIQHPFTTDAICLEGLSSNPLHKRPVFTDSYFYHFQHMVNEVVKRHSEKPPCSHNEWDNIRFKNMIVTLRCRVCREQWKTLNVSLRKCAAFYERKCPNGPKCELTHIHRYKHTREMCVKSINGMNADNEEPQIRVYQNKPKLQVAVPPPQDKSSIWSSDVWEEESHKWDLWDREPSYAMFVSTATN